MTFSRHAWYGCGSVAPLARERLFERGVESRPVDVGIECPDLEAGGQHGLRLRLLQRPHHPEERPHPLVLPARKESGGAGVADEMCRLEVDPLAGSEPGLELSCPRLDRGEQQRPDAATGVGRVDVSVGDDPAVADLREMHHSGERVAVDCEPGVLLEVEALPLLPQLLLGPVGIAIDRVVAGLHERESRCEVFRPVGAAKFHGGEV